MKKEQETAKAQHTNELAVSKGGRNVFRPN